MCSFSRVCWKGSRWLHVEALPQVLQKHLPDSVAYTWVLNICAAPSGSAGQLGIGDCQEALAVPRQCLPLVSGCFDLLKRG